MGLLLKQLRQKLGYSLEEWAAIFETTPTIVASIEFGQEMPDIFLTHLIGWFNKTLEHPQKPTYVSSQIPETLADWFKPDYLPNDQETQNLRSRVLAIVKKEMVHYKRQIEFYMQMITEQRADLEIKEARIAHQEKQIEVLKGVQRLVSRRGDQWLMLFS